MKPLKIILFFALLFSLTAAYTQSIPESIPTKKERGNIDEQLQKKETPAKKKTEEKEKKEQPESEQKQREEKTQIQPEEKPQNKTEDSEKKETSEKIEPEKKIKQAEEKPAEKEIPTVKPEYQIGKPEKIYTQKGVMELGGMVWGQLRAITRGYDTQFGSLNAFFHYFLVDYFLTGIRIEGTYDLDQTTYQASGYGVLGGAFPLTDSLFMSLTVNIGYSINNTDSSRSLFSYGNEIGFKIKLKGNYLIGVSALYSFYTDFTKDFFNDKVKGTIYFSGYF